MDKIPLPDSVTVAREEGSEATFEISPYFPGYGPTVGNALRRVLLSSLPGAAITAVRFEDIEHEFSTLPGVAEDFVSIVLNLKRVRVKLHGDQSVELRLRASDLKTVTAGDIEKVANVEIANPDHVIAHLTKEKAKLDLLLTVESGRGYLPVESRDRENRPIGTIAIDAIFTPVERVSYRIENVRVGQITEFHKLLITVRTDGTITPREALAQAAAILEDHFHSLAGDVRDRLTYRREAPASELMVAGPNAAVPIRTEVPASVLSTPPEERLVDMPVPGAVRAPEERLVDTKLIPVVGMAVSTRIQNILEKEGMKTVAGLIQKTRSQLLGLPGLGEKALEEIEQALRNLGVSLREESSPT